MRVIALSLFITCSLRTAHSRAKLPDAITFPEELSDEMEKDPCEGLTYCTVKPRDYPQDKFNEMFKSHTVLHQPSPMMEVLNRIGEDEDDDQCKSEVTYAKLYKVRDSKNNAWQNVIQVPRKNFVQKVRMEICVNENNECFTVFPGRGSMYKAGCLQKHMSWQFLVYNAEKNKTELIKTTVPSCCSCYYSESV